MVENSRLVEQFSSCVNSVLAKYSLPRTGELLNKLPSILNSICADKSVLKKINPKNKSERGFVESILALFGVTRVKNTITIDENFFRQFVEIDSDIAAKNLDNIARGFQELENRLELERNKLIEQIEQQASSIEQLRKERRILQNQYEVDKEAYFSSMQRILEDVGPNPSMQELAKLEQTVIQSLEQFGVKAVWNIPGQDDGKMFLIQRTGRMRERTVQRPCLMGESGLILKGLVYQEAEE